MSSFESLKIWTSEILILKFCSVYQKFSVLEGQKRLILIFAINDVFISVIKNYQSQYFWPLPLAKSI